MSPSQESELNAMAEKFGVSANSLKAMVKFVTAKVQAEPELQQIISEGTAEAKAAMIVAGVESWHAQTKNLALELLHNRTYRAQVVRNEFAGEVYAAIHKAETR